MSATLLLDTCSNYGKLVMLILMTNFYELFLSFLLTFLVFSDFSFSTVDITDGLDYNTDKIYLFSAPVMIINANGTQKFQL